MNDYLHQLTNLLNLSDALPALSSITIIGFGILFAFGVLNCVLGYRLLRFWMMLFGFIIGALIGFGIAFTGGMTEYYMYALIMVIAGVILSVIAFLSYKIGVFILGAGLGFGLGLYLLHPTTSLMFFICILIGVVLGVLAMKQARVILIVGTSLFGGVMAGFSAAKIGGLDDFPYGAGMSLGFVLLGMLIQFATNRDRDDDEEYDDEDKTLDYNIKRGEQNIVDEGRLEDEVIREMMEDNDREGEELWKKISRRDERSKKSKFDNHSYARRKEAQNGKRSKDECDEDA